MDDQKKIKFIALGGAHEIGASCFYLNIEGTGILLDCGIHPQKKGIQALPEFDLINNVELDFVIISHSHQDHIGALPFLIKRFPHVKIIATPQTLEVAKLTLHNSVKILSNYGSDEEMLVFTHDEVDLLLKSAIDLSYNEQFDLLGIRHKTEEAVRLQLFDAGHIIGSSSILLEYKSERIFYTGDLKLSKQFLMNGAKLPRGRVTTLITETTYGNTPLEQLSDIKLEVKRFVDSANSTISDGGSILLPLFALGKMQEVLWMIHSQMKKGKLTEVPIFIGGLGKKIIRVYDNNRFIVNYTSGKNNLSEIETNDFYEIPDLHKLKNNPCIVLASSGMMLPRTSSFRFGEFWLTQENFAIHTVGYMDPDSPGYKIANADKGDEIEFGSSNPIKVNCNIRRFFFPTHSNRNELIKIVDKLNPQKVLLIHGDEDAKDWVGQQLLELDSKRKIHSTDYLEW